MKFCIEVGTTGGFKHRSSVEDCTERQIQNVRDGFKAMLGDEGAGYLELAVNKCGSKVIIPLTKVEYVCIDLTPEEAEG